MGSWGYDPLQNDTADDWVLDIGTLLAERIEATLSLGRDEAEWEEVRAACWLLEKLGSATPEIWNSDTYCLQLRQGIDWLT